MKTIRKIWGIIAIVVIITVGMGACASAPPTDFELAGSLEGTAWLQGSLLVMNDKTSGVLTDREDKETAFTYTASFDAENPSFTGTITLEDGRVVNFTAKKKGGLFGGWKLTAKALEENDLIYITQKILEEEYRERAIKAEIVEKYGNEYLGLDWDIITRNGDNKMITYNTSSGLHEITRSVINFVTEGYRLHSKDGVTMTLFSVHHGRYDSAEGVGTFKISVGNDFVTISNGMGAGVKFNGTYTRVARF